MAQRSASSDGVTATLWAVVEEIDDDDEDILEVTIDVTNESNRDLWDINGDIRAMDGTHAHPRGAPSRIESGEGDELKFWVPSDTGAWLFKIDFNTDSGPGTVELGPFTNDLRIVAASRPERIPKNSVKKMASGSSDAIADAFGIALEGFGHEEVNESPVLEADVASNDPMQAAFAGGLLESQQAPSPPEQLVQPSVQSPGPPAGPPPSSPPSSPPSGPPTGPPPSSPPTTGPPGKPPGPPPSGSPPGPPPKSAKPPGPPPS